MSALLEQRVEWIMAEAEVDYINLSMIIDAANEAHDAEPGLSRMERTFALLRRLLERGFQAVDLIKDGKCAPWPDQNPDAIIRRIETEWRRIGINEEPHIGAIFWFDLPKTRR